MGFRAFWSAKGMLFGLGASACFVVALVPLAMGGLEQFSATESLWARAPVGLDGETPRQRDERLERARRAHERVRWDLYVAEAIAILGVLSAAGAAVQARETVRSWHWLAFAGFGATAAALGVATGAPYGLPARIAYVTLSLLGLVLPSVDLARPRRGPGRVFAWLALVLWCAAFCLFGAAK